VKLNDAAVKAIYNSDISGPALVGVFEKMAQGLLGVNAPGGMLNLNFIPPDTLPEEGDLIPVITLALRPFRNLRPQHPPERVLKRVVPVRKDNPYKEGPQGCPVGEPGEQRPEGIDKQQETE